MNNPGHLGLPIPQLNKKLIYQFWYDYVKPKYGGKVKLCCMDTDSFTVKIKTNDIYKDVAEDVEIWFDTSHYELECNSNDKQLSKRKNKKVIVLMKDELGGKIMTKFVGWTKTKNL